MSVEIEHWREVHDEYVADSGQVSAAQVASLERNYDRAMQNIPDPDELGERFEEFLRELHDQNDDGADNTE